MKFVIYGAGKRGKEVLEVIGKDNIVAFADKDSSKIGAEYCGLPVIGIEELREISESTICIVTPVSYRDSIAMDLNNKGIRNCIPLKPFDRVLYYEKESVMDDVLNQYCNVNIGIYGISAASIILYQYLKSRMNRNIFLIPDKEQEVNDVLCNEGIRVADLADALQDIDVIICTEIALEDDKAQIIPKDTRVVKMQELLEANISFCNKEIEKFKGIHNEQRCFIVATGPSLTIQDLEILETNNEKCIAMNRIYNLFERTSWRPDYYMIEDTMMIEDLCREIADMDIPVKFVASIPSEYWMQENIGNSIKYQLINLDHLGNELPFFSTKMEHCVYEGSTVTYACIQLAVYMGFKEIYLLGVDFNYSEDLYDEKNHFAGYQSDKRVRLNKVYPERMRAAYESAEQYAKAHGIKIYNATRGGKLEVFERVNFDVIF